MLELSFASVIGRPEVSYYDVEELRKDFKLKRILITGAGGSIGSEITRQIVHLGSSSILATDRDENALHSLQLSIGGSALFDDERIGLLDVRDYIGCEKLISDFEPDIVIHAAALKHLSALEKQPREAYMTNVLGTHNILKAAINSGATNFVNISTDKAASPTSILGKTKRIAEILTYAAFNETANRYNSVRFGNVFASKGSVLETFEFQIKNNLPITLTSESVERYFMSVFEASALVLKTIPAAEIGIYTLDMGEPRKLIEVAHRLMKLLSTTVPIAITGLRPGEKMHEDLISEVEKYENSTVSNANLISQVTDYGISEIKPLTTFDNATTLEEIDRLLGFGMQNSQGKA